MCLEKDTSLFSIFFIIFDHNIFWQLDINDDMEDDDDDIFEDLFIDDPEFVSEGSDFPQSSCSNYFSAH